MLYINIFENFVKWFEPVVIQLENIYTTSIQNSNDEIKRFRRE